MGNQIKIKTLLDVDNFGSKDLQEIYLKYVGNIEKKINKKIAKNFIKEIFKCYQLGNKKNNSETINLILENLFESKTEIGFKEFKESYLISISQQKPKTKREISLSESIMVDLKQLRREEEISNNFFGKINQKELFEKIEEACDSVLGGLFLGGKQIGDKGAKFLSDVKKKKNVYKKIKMLGKKKKKKRN